MLAGKVLDVKPDEDEDEGEKPAANIPLEQASEAVMLFEAETKSMQEAEFVEKAKKLQRGFFVLAGETKLDLVSGELKSNLTCHTVLIGP